MKEDYREIGRTDMIWSINVGPKSEAEIISYNEIGAAADKNTEFLEAFDTLMVTSKDVSILKDIRSRNSWIFKVVNNGLFSDKVEYQLTLSNSDIK
ncbi:MAG: hypothetical protein IPM82_01895 [Saprospiraceae bacterium]|nr:hypothetical protein [Saprospiraceae bacterium]